MTFEEWNIYLRKTAKQLEPEPFLALELSQDIALEDLGDFNYKETDNGIIETFTLHKRLMN